MEENNKEFQINNKHIFSLAAVMLFAPFIPFILKSWDYELSENDKLFINWYVKYWLLLDLILWLAAIVWIINILNNFVIILNYISQILLIIGLAWIIFWIFYVFSDKPMFLSKSLKEDYFKNIRAWNIDILFYFLPIYNFYLWYFGKQDIKSYWWIKESVIISCFWILLYLITWSFYINILFIFIYIVRIISLIWWIDFVPDHIKEKLDKLFEKNPEEMYWYLKWTAKYFIDKIKSKWHELNNAPQVYITNAKKEFVDVVDLSWNKIIIIEYAILTIIAVYELYYLFYELRYMVWAFIYFIPTMILIWRYVVLLSNKKAVYLPVIHEIVLYSNKVFKFLK